ncbi:hypothetical protein Tcan_03363 [Toxocara canis]|uniref:Uncharacterized protein n=1 Tax=Toxocara canis TaxID=6265 RepID=A0A0B2VRK1_TOXCA|nr:hypothetical protein Tcan_03363 [Toxocara canis]
MDAFWVTALVGSFIMNCYRAATPEPISHKEFVELSRAYLEKFGEPHTNACTLLGTLPGPGNTRKWLDGSTSRFLVDAPDHRELCLGADGEIYAREEKKFLVICQCDYVSDHLHSTVGPFIAQTKQKSY